MEGWKTKQRGKRRKRTGGALQEGDKRETREEKDRERGKRRKKRAEGGTQHRQ